MSYLSPEKVCLHPAKAMDRLQNITTLEELALHGIHPCQTRCTVLLGQGYIALCGDIFASFIFEPATIPLA